MTEAGRKILKEIVLVGQDLDRVVLAGLSDADIETTELVLSRMKENIHASIGNKGEAKPTAGGPRRGPGRRGAGLRGGSRACGGVGLRLSGECRVVGPKRNWRPPIPSC